MTDAGPDDLVAISEIKLDGVRCRLVNDVRAIEFSDLARFQQRFIFGDPSKDDNELLSSWQLGNFSGGHGVAILKEGSDEGRFEFGTMYGRFPGMVTKPLYAGAQSTAVTGAVGNKQVLGEFYGTTANRFYVVYLDNLNVRRGVVSAATNLHALDATYATPSSGNLTSLPVAKGTAFQGTHTEERFFIPQGNNGYAWISETSAAPTEFSDPRFRDFTVFDNKLVGVTTGGRMYRTYDGTTWTAYDLLYQLSKSYRVRNLFTGPDRQDQNAVFIVTDRDLWQFDPDGPELFRIEHNWPSHPRSGIAASYWRGAMYISVGMGVWRYTGGTWMPVGLDRDYGLPAEYQGYISHFAEGSNGLYAMVQADGTEATYGGISSIHEFNGNAWQTVWTQDTSVPSSIQYHAALSQTQYTMGGMVITQSGTVQTLVFGTGGSDDRIYTCPLYMDNANPRAGVRKGQAFGAGQYYYLETGEFDADMLGFTQIGNAIQAYLEEPIASSTTKDTFRVVAQFDRGDWELIFSTSAGEGRYAAPFGDALDTGLYSGRSFERANLRFELINTGTVTVTRPLIWTNAVLSFLKTVASNDSFTIAIETKDGDAGGTMNALEFQDWIDALTSRKQFVLMTVGQRNYRVFVAQNTGTRATGDGVIGIRHLSIVEVPTGLS